MTELETAEAKPPIKKNRVTIVKRFSSAPLSLNVFGRLKGDLWRNGKIFGNHVLLVFCYGSDANRSSERTAVKWSVESIEVKVGLHWRLLE